MAPPEKSQTEESAANPSAVENPTSTVDTGEVSCASGSYDEIQSSYIDAKNNMFRIFFDKPSSEGNTQNQSGAQEWAGLNKNENYKSTVGQIKSQIDLMHKALLNAVREKISKVGITHAETQKALAAVDASLRHTLIIGQAKKTVITPYRKYGTERSTADLRYENFQTAELEHFQGTLNLLEQLKPEDLIEMTLQNGEYLTMLAEVRGLEDKGGPTNRDVDSKGRHVNKFDLKNNPEKYFENMGKLRDFIISSNKRGGVRSALEVDLWAEIIRGMNLDQRKDLILQFIKSGNEKEAKEILVQFVDAGLMKKGEAMEIFIMCEVSFDNAVADDAINVPNGAKKQFEEIVEFASMRAVARQAGDSEHATALDQASVGSAVSHYFTFNNFILSRIAELGALTAIVNLIAEVADGVVSSPKGTSVVVGGIKGGANAIKNPFVLGGAAVAAAGTLAVVGLPNSTPDSAEKALVAENKAYEWIDNELGVPQDQSGAHYELGAYMLKNYDMLYSSAKAQQGAFPKRGFLPYVDAIKITTKQAKDMGYGETPEGVEKAKGKIVAFFNAAVAIGAENKNDLYRKLNDKGVRNIPLLTV